MKIEWYGHASFKIISDQNTTIFIDPYKISSSHKVDIVLSTHSHFDHFSPEDISKIVRDDSILIAPSDCKMENIEKIDISLGETRKIKDIEIKTVPAYNVNKPFHPKENNWVGYILTVDGITIYHTGDSDFIPEMKEISPEIALLPVSGTYVMDYKEAAEAARVMKVKKAIPMHYGKGVVGEKKDAINFSELLKHDNIEVEIMDILE